jgi:hypothetical protein
MRPSCLLLAMLLVGGFPGRADDAAKKDDAPWSPPVQGLRARLYTLPSKEPEFDKTYDVWIEIQEVGAETSLGVKHRAVTIRFLNDDSQLQVTLTDGSGNAVSESGPGAPVEAAVVRDLVIPPKGDLTFPIGYGGSSPHHPPPGEPTPRGRLLIFASVREWLVPNDTGLCHLGVSLEVSNVTGQYPNSPPYTGWAGTLELPAIELPAR